MPNIEAIRAELEQGPRSPGEIDELMSNIVVDPETVARYREMYRNRFGRETKQNYFTRWSSATNKTCLIVSEAAQPDEQSSL